MSLESNNSSLSHGNIDLLKKEIEETYRGVLEVFYTLGDEGKLEDVIVLKEEINKLTVELDETYRGVIELVTNLESDEQKIELLTKSAGLGLWDWEPASGVFTVADDWLDLVGLDKRNSIGKITDWDNLIHQDDLPGVQHARAAFLKGEKMFFHSEHRLVTSSGVWKWFLSNGRALKSSVDGKPELVAGSIIDIDNRKKTEERIRRTNLDLERRIFERTIEIERTNYKLMEEIREHQHTLQALRQARKSAEAANKAKSVFLANMSHELRTPLHAILGFSQLMQNDTNLSKSQAKRLGIINSSGIYLQNLINDVLEISKIESGRITLHSVSFDFYEMLQDIGLLFQARLDEKKLYFRISKKESVPQYLFGDEGKLKQILINLLGNAIKFTDEGGVDFIVDYDAKKRQPLKILIRDTGIGIEPDDIKKLFEPFEQGRAGIHKGGSGLGLAISREYIELMKGKLDVKSEPGKGSEFTLTCQIKEAGSSPATDQEVKRNVIGIKGGPKSKCVLVVDDNDLNRSFLVQTLSTMGFATKEADNGKVALDVFVKEKPDIVLMDTHMAVMNGETAMGYIRKLDAGKNVPIIFVTADVVGTHKDELLIKGANGLLYKPFRELELIRALKECANIEFIYEEDRLVNVDENTKLDINILSKEVRNKLSRATFNGSIIELRNIVNEVQNTEPVVASELLKLVNDYKYGQLLELLDQ